MVNVDVPAGVGAPPLDTTTGKTKPFHMPALGRFPSKKIHTLKVYRKFSFHLYIRVKNDILN